ncbi:hypothetical protein JCM19037_4064 [Geomicrobium sp. JCM 19037]|uniref:GNAT family N-acetyltransferase n=1 Tax=Geomicrobium sp. JCM 19037 TaxID=1460634 RepID=UPI00045F2CDC|nr:GNAT family N-acetyltransferase [Geomicrobium sp. JCM 19037]GAK05556.1 hypothetical protein JCM19037_4064 [Geomicrobium sp. JCM 19037]
MQIRKAEPLDTERLIKMRWDFTIEDHPEKEQADVHVYEKECRRFLEEAIAGDRWHIWVAERAGVIVSHIYIQLVDKVPRPGRVTRPFAYMTNVYTVPSHRGTGIGSQLLEHIHQWVKEHEYEFILVWPSEAGEPYYKKNGYTRVEEPMEYIRE